MKPEVLFEDDYYLIIDKPSGLVVHEDGKIIEPTVVDWILENYPQIRGVGENMEVKDRNGELLVLKRPGIVHRIDRDTSGCLIIVKNQTSFDYLKKLFQEHQVQKTYQALVYGNVKNNRGDIDARIGKHRSDFRMRDAGPHARGILREAHTTYQVITRYEDKNTFDKQKQTIKYTLLEMSPTTGRTHQIRVHLKYLNYPIVSDPLYAGRRKKALGLHRTALHAASISFVDRNGKVISVRAEIPRDMKSALEQLSVLD